MEDKHIFQSNTRWYQQCLDNCEEFGISKAVINLYIHQQNNEQNNKRTTDYRI